MNFPSLKIIFDLFYGHPIFAAIFVKTPDTTFLLHLHLYLLPSSPTLGLDRRELSVFSEKKSRNTKPENTKPTRGRIFSHAGYELVPS